MCYRCYARCPQEVNFTDVMRALRFLAIKGGYAPPDMLANSDDVDRFSQTIRRDMIKNTIEGRKQVIKEIKAKMSEISKE